MPIYMATYTMPRGAAGHHQDGRQRHGTNNGVAMSSTRRTRE
jgi:hypothetical protein